MTPANQPLDDAMEGRTLVQGKRGKQKARAPLYPSDAEAPRKTRKGGTDTEPSAMPTSEIHPPVSGGEDKIALEGRIFPPWETLPSETLEEAPSARISPPTNPEATVIAGSRGETPRVAEDYLSSMYEEIEALGLTPVTQGEDDLLPAGLDLGKLTPVPLSPCSLPLTAFLGGHPSEGSPPPDAVAAKSTTEPAPSITGSPLPTPLTLKSFREAPALSCLPLEAQSLASAPAPTPSPVPAQSTSSCNGIAAPGVISFPFLADPPQGAAFAFSCRDPLGAAIFPPPPPFPPRLEMDLITLACQMPRRWSAPCLPASVDQEAAPRAPPGNNREIATPPPMNCEKRCRNF
ncbi:hypothetical protein UY3_07380 [Chelonia mydas]|uniref:Uncharacterized protein n=1 Tax=Chelonia mydas TaxID=8469 RepID=M7C4L6_CHEMY|nr:hypothetical protein UY3_07380 [Chelonia mydas]